MNGAPLPPRRQKPGLDGRRPRRSRVRGLTEKNIDLIARLKQEAEASRTPGERVADFIASAIGSWTFILVQSALFALYIVLNVIAYIRHWDPYPFILLNLFLSFQAAYTGPILMMSQNRQLKVAERRNHLDLQINLLAERESTQTLRLLRRLCKKNGISIDDPDTPDLERKTEPGEVIREIEKKETR